MRLTILLAAAPAFALAACGAPTDEAATDTGETTETPMPVEPDGGLGDGATALPEDTAAIPERSIPLALRGRWGLVPADCTSTRGDAKGLLTISPTTLTFYESVGTLGAIEQRSNDRIRADFAFTGEGMTWNRDVALEVQRGGKTLVRREYGEDAATGPFEYTRCN